MQGRPRSIAAPNRCYMTGKKVVWTIIAVAAALVLGLLLSLRAHRLRVIAERLSVPIEGAVIQRDADTNRQLPIADVVITATDGVRSAATQSDASGYFKLVLHKRVLSEQPITVTFRHPRYQPLEITVPTGRLQTPSRLYVAALVPLVPPRVRRPRLVPAARPPWSPTSK